MSENIDLVIITYNVKKEGRWSNMSENIDLVIIR